jgi:hypothetical protein
LNLAGVAQVVERLFHTQKVRSSTLLAGTEVAMTIIEAVNQVRAVKKLSVNHHIRRMTWAPAVFIDVWDDDDLGLCWTDILANDWEIVPQPEKNSL